MTSSVCIAVHIIFLSPWDSLDAPAPVKLCLQFVIPRLIDFSSLRRPGEGAWFGLEQATKTRQQHPAQLTQWVNHLIAYPLTWLLLRLKTSLRPCSWDSRLPYTLVVDSLATVVECKTRWFDSRLQLKKSSVSSTGSSSRHWSVLAILLLH